MPSYHIPMGRALMLNALAGNVIYTGPPPDADTLRSCSAVIMVNTVLGSGGMYHYPSGDYGTDLHARNIVDLMGAAIAPNEVYLYYGLADRRAEGINTGAYDLTTYLLRFVPHVHNRKASTGQVSVTIAGGGTQLADQRMLCNVDVGTLALGPFANGIVWV